MTLPDNPPQVPKELEWEPVKNLDKTACVEVANTAFGSYGLYPCGGVTFLTADLRVPDPLVPESLKDKAAAQQHFDSLIAECCTVKRCVWKYRRLIAGGVDCGPVDAYDTECGKGYSESKAKQFNYCPNCGGVMTNKERVERIRRHLQETILEWAEMYPKTVGNPESFAGHVTGYAFDDLLAIPESEEPQQ